METERPRPMYRATTFPPPEQAYPTLALLVDDLRRTCPEEGAELKFLPGPDSRSGTLTAETRRTEGEWHVYRMVALEINDNRVVRRVVAETPMTAFWVR